MAIDHRVWQIIGVLHPWAGKKVHSRVPHAETEHQFGPASEATEADCCAEKGRLISKEDPGGGRVTSQKQIVGESGRMAEEGREDFSWCQHKEANAGNRE